MGKKSILQIFMAALLPVIFASICMASICGDGACGAGENWDNCPEDCGIGGGFNLVNSRDIGEIYTPKEDMILQWKSLCSNHTETCSYESVGKSLLGKEIFIFKIGNELGGKALFDGQMHGMEDCGTETGYKFAKWILESGDSEANRILSNNYALFIPVLNPDTLRRQNARTNYTLESGRIINVSYGVDLNRNFASGWMSGNRNPASLREYRGLYALSEPEAQALRNALVVYRPKVYVNVHCGQEIIKYYANTTLEQDIISRINSINPRTNRRFNTGFYQTGAGYSTAEAKSLGISAWLLEISTWTNMPKTLPEYHSRWYSLSEPVYRAILNAIEIVSSGPAQTPEEQLSPERIIDGENATVSPPVEQNPDSQPEDIIAPSENKTTPTESPGNEETSPEDESSLPGQNRKKEDFWDLSRMKFAEDTLFSVEDYLVNGSFEIEAKIKIDKLSHSYILYKEKELLVQLRPETALTKPTFQIGIFRGGVWQPIIDSKTTPAAGKEYELKVSYDKATGKIRLYIDGIIEAEKSIAYLPDTQVSALYIGNNKGLNRDFYGMIDYVKLDKIG